MSKLRWNWRSFSYWFSNSILRLSWLILSSWSLKNSDVLFTRFWTLPSWSSSHSSIILSRNANYIILEFSRTFESGTCSSESRSFKACYFLFKIAISYSLNDLTSFLFKELWSSSTFERSIHLLSFSWASTIF